MVAIFMDIDKQNYGPFINLHDAIDFASLTDPNIREESNNFGSSDTDVLELPYWCSCSGHSYFIYGV